MRNFTSWRCNWWNGRHFDALSIYVVFLKTILIEFVKSLWMFVKFVKWKFTSYTIMRMLFIFCFIILIKSYLKSKCYQIFWDTLYLEALITIFIVIASWTIKSISWLYWHHLSLSQIIYTYMNWVKVYTLSLFKKKKAFPFELSLCLK